VINPNEMYAPHIVQIASRLLTNKLSWKLMLIWRFQEMLWIKPF